MLPWYILSDTFSQLYLPIHWEPSRRDKGKPKVEELMEHRLPRQRKPHKSEWKFFLIVIKVAHSIHYDDEILKKAHTPE